MQLVMHFMYGFQWSLKHFSASETIPLKIPNYTVLYHKMGYLRLAHPSIINAFQWGYQNVLNQLQIMVTQGCHLSQVSVQFHIMRLIFHLPSCVTLCGSSIGSEWGKELFSLARSLKSTLRVSVTKGSQQSPSPFLKILLSSSCLNSWFLPESRSLWRRLSLPKQPLHLKF